MSEKWVTVEYLDGERRTIRNEVKNAAFNQAGTVLHIVWAGGSCCDHIPVSLIKNVSTGGFDFV
jgi:hypothetical protein